MKIAEQPQGHDIQSLHFGQQLTNNWYSKGANENPEEVVQFIIAKITKKIGMYDWIKVNYVSFSDLIVP